MNNANKQCPLKTKTGTEQSKSDDLGMHWATPHGCSWLKFLPNDFTNTTNYITCILPIL